MRKIVFADIRLILFSIAFFLLFQQTNVATAQPLSSSRINIQIVTDEADAVLQILAKKENAQEITEADWQRVFQSEGYVRLKKRELSLKRPFEESVFKNFVLTQITSERYKALSATLAKWKETDINRVGRLPLAYLPKTAQIRAKVYPVIKPRDNSFVFDIPADPAIFIYLDPEKSKEEFENHFAHELHHIGFGSGCPTAAVKEEIAKLPPKTQRMLIWLGAFGEGFAMLAAAGGADVHPHKFSSAEERARWDKDVANFNNELKTVEKFLLDLVEGKLTEEAEVQTARSFYGVQGPWYTVGWQMAVVIEKTFGRKKLIEVMCDQRQLLPAYNEAAAKYNRRNNKQLALWSTDLAAKIK